MNRVQQKNSINLWPDLDLKIQLDLYFFGQTRLFTFYLKKNYQVCPSVLNTQEQRSQISFLSSHRRDDSLLAISIALT